MLWCFVAPICLLIAFIDGIGKTDKIVDVYSAVAIGVIPFGVLAISAWLGILLPYHPIPIRYRWSQRRNWWPMLLRWGTLVLLPYALVPALTVALLSPTLLLWGLMSPKRPDHEAARQRPRSRHRLWPASSPSSPSTGGPPHLAPADRPASGRAGRLPVRPAAGLSRRRARPGSVPGEP